MDRCRLSGACSCFSESPVPDRVRWIVVNSGILLDPLFPHTRTSDNDKNNEPSPREVMVRLHDLGGNGPFLSVAGRFWRGVHVTRLHTDPRNCRTFSRLQIKG